MIAFALCCVCCVICLLIFWWFAYNCLFFGVGQLFDFACLFCWAVGLDLIYGYGGFDYLDAVWCVGFGWIWVGLYFWLVFLFWLVWWFRFLRWVWVDEFGLFLMILLLSFVNSLLIWVVFYLVFAVYLTCRICFLRVLGLYYVCLILGLFCLRWCLLICLVYTGALVLLTWICMIWFCFVCLCCCASVSCINGMLFWNLKFSFAYATISVAIW